MSNSHHRATKVIMRELVHLHSNWPAEDVRLIETPDILDIQAWMAGPDATPYSGGLFKVKITPGPEFPSCPPKAAFLTKIFHPNVSSTGEICVNILKRDWKPELGIKHILLTIRCLLVAPNAESALNDEAGKLLLEDYAAFAKHAALVTSVHATLPPCAQNPFHKALPRTAAAKQVLCASALETQVCTQEPTAQNNLAHAPDDDAQATTKKRAVVGGSLAVANTNNDAGRRFIKKSLKRL